jgi:tetratricopeptide (TPR) repeat protein
MANYNFSAEEIKKLENLLLSPDEHNVMLAIELLNNHGFPEELEKPLAILANSSKDHLSLDADNAVYKLYKQLPEHKRQTMEMQIQLPSYYDLGEDFEKEGLLQHIDDLQKNYGQYLDQRPHLQDNIVYVANTFYGEDEEHQEIFAETLYKLLISWRTTNKSVYFKQAILEEYKNKDSDAAIGCYLALLQVDPQHHTAHGNIGLQYQSQNKVDLAIHHFKESIKIKPTYTFSLNNLAYIYWKKSDHYDEACDLYEQVLQLDPDYNYALANYAALLIEHYEGQLERAEKMLRQAIEIDDKFDYPWKILGRLMMAKTPPELETALDAYEKAHLYDPDDEETIAELNEVKAALKNG